MNITSNCLGCGLCEPLCPQDAIHLEETASGRKASIDNEKCLECGVCLDSGVCCHGAIEESTETRAEIRRLFGSMTPKIPGQKKHGRTGSWDVKTCDAGTPLPADTVIVRIELGRPEGGVCLAQAEELRQMLLRQGHREAPQKSYRRMLELVGPDGLCKEAGAIRVLSVCLEYCCDPLNVPDLLALAQEWARSRNISYRANALFPPVLLEEFREILDRSSHVSGPRCKLNLGLARHREAAV